MIEEHCLRSFRLQNEDEDFFGSGKASFTTAAVENECENNYFEEIMDNAAFKLLRGRHH